MNERIFETIDSEQKAYWVGFLAADGSIFNQKRLIIGLAEKDKQQLEHFREFLSDNKEIYKRDTLCTNNGKRYPTCYYEVYSNPLVKDLSHYGIIQNKSHLNIDFLQYIPEKYKINFIFGLLDGDGWFLNVKSAGFGICGNHDLIDSVRKYLINYFKWDQLNLNQYSISKSTFYFQTQSYYKIRDFVSKYLLYPYHLPRKISIAQKILTRAEEKIRDIENRDIENRTNKQTAVCLICGKTFNQKRNNQIYCSQECVHRSQQRTNRPSREELKQLIRTTSFLEIGRQFGVSDNAIRKWCIAMNLPKTKKEIKSYSDTEWSNI